MSKARTLADFISDGSEFADGTISVAEVSGAAPLASPTFTGTASGTFSGPLTGNVTGNVTGDLTGDVTGNVTGNLTGNVTGDVAGDIDLSAIAATISDTAVDIFVYDTRKDSDGGAWRKRTQHTSWYNETLNTATRGSRKEFPAVAVIVAESALGGNVNIYDGDDPDMPLWMTFNNTGVLSWATGSSINLLSVAALNGIVFIGTNAQGGVHIDFNKDYIRLAHSSNSYGLNGDRFILNRNSSGIGYVSGSDGYNLVNYTINDVAMTVLPNAPIDAATGLPVPTIAVATASGTSVIRDDGTVVDITADGTIGGVDKVAFYGTNKLWTGCNTVGSGTRNSYSYFIPTSDTTAASTTFRIGRYVDPSTSGGDLFYSNIASNIQNSIAYGENNIAADADDMGLSRISENEAAPSTGMTNFTTSDYNTGWMNGDIKLATLSDTDDTNVTGSELVTNGTFDTDTSGWTASALTTSVSSGQATLTMTSTYGTFVQGITTEVGKTYTITCDIVSETVSGAIYLGAGTTSGGSQIGLFTTSVGSNAFTFVATGTTTYVALYLNGASSQTAVIDNFTARLAEEDRSVNGNGLQVFGTVTKSAVATGADLVGYGPFTNANYLKQPYNSDLDFGTGDFSISVWVKSTDSVSPFVVRTDGTNPSLIFGMYTTDRVWFKLISTGGTTDRISTAITEADDGNWTHLVALRRGERHELYANGVLKDGYTGANRDLSSYGSGQELYVGWDGTDIQTGPLNGSLALLRISATAPSPEQIRKIYEDEKVLFQDGAQATLYGESDAVTALAYDDSTELLHVGTSAGRSVFQGLRRVDNTTTAVGAAISASNGLVADE